MENASRAAARHFIDNETEFHLGFLPTEQSNPLTRTMERDFAASTAAGIRTLQRPDRDVLTMARRTLAGAEFARMTETGYRTIRDGGRIVFSGCGATGRLSILLESMWREYFATAADRRYADSVASIMTGGDYALVRSVEFFEDYQSFGRRQAADLDMGPSDMLVAITEGGETSSVIGTVKEAADRGSAVFLMFNNPASLLRERLVRCREVIDDPRVTVLDLSCGPMAVAGSTRMQATTSEQLIGGALLETILARLEGGTAADFAAGFATVLDHLESAECIEKLAGYIDFETETYRAGGRITYFACDYLLDLFTDTTERAPTFMLPPFRRRGDTTSPMSWAFVKNPCFDTRETWRHMLNRKPRCLDWSSDDYRTMGADDRITERLPHIAAEDLYRIEVGNEPAPERFAGAADHAVLFTVAGAPENEALRKCTAAFSGGKFRTFELVPAWPDSSLSLLNHMMVKLVWNTVSTGVMARLGRISGNWMSWVDISNKKLIDRAIRLIAELGHLEYEQAAFALYDAVDRMQHEDWSNREKPSPVQYTLRRLSNRN